MKIKRYLFVVLGAALMALSLDMFLVPGGIAPGGVSGLATVISRGTNLPVGLLIFLINVPVFIWGMIEFDIGFLISSLVGTILLSVFTESFAPFITPVTDNEVLLCVFGGGMMGLGMGLVISSGSTTGGTDIVAKILKKKFPHISIGAFVMLIDAIVVILSGIISRRWETMLFSAAALYVSVKSLDAVTDGVEFAKTAFIISDSPEIITKEISDKMKRGTTLLNGFSSYTNKNKNVILCVVLRSELTTLKEIVKSVDNSAFLIVSDAKEVLGNGFGA